MNTFLRAMILLKVLVLLSLGSSAAWAECDEHEKQAAYGQVAQGELMLAANEEQTPGDQDNDDSSIDEDPDGDSQT
ncbi:hypothetical protein [Pseudomonas fluorescens]|uniref:Secreted protein n=1 Tax=Pseudomonas fluorescens TaxID=294 RepID=A0A944DJL5_PSEFL|nr:hypothetical protein [Pseudomonas fluorescens]MBT2311816.1 hypothetical protein [Pseudomonas fluorescens]MBT2316767.1 hypothetical protein [Pseudomonas fluorescens]MBT2329804.1 hypothetical protein [Pseudomonas fluorescens]MBT2344586.1 hypothetical protein [Pseudomonas fluorescens]MBT2348024.1 hypothetical protein [Pseudomonas fluorescens]